VIDYSPVARVLREKNRNFVVFAAVLGLFYAVSAVGTGFSAGGAVLSFPKAIGWLAVNLVPGEKSAKVLPKVLSKLGETIIVSIMATVMAAALAFVLAVLSSKTTRPSTAVAAGVRFFASFCRNVPLVAWAILFLLSFGQTVVTGVMALFIGTLGYLTRAFIETIEDVAESSVEALRAAGAPWLALVFRAVLPSVLPQSASWMLYMIETNIRDATLVGILTGTGIGFLFDLYYKSMNFQAAGLVVLGLIVTVIAIETASNALRRAFL
jgi:phosphonate transport system permease protein